MERTKHTSSPLAIVVLLLMAVALSASPALAARAPGNDTWRKATTISALPFSTTQDTTGARSGGDPLSSCTPVTHTVWYTFTPATDMTITANTFGSEDPTTEDYDTVLTVYTRSDKQFNEVTCNDDTSGHDSQVTFSATAGTTYYFMIGSYHDTPGGNLVFNVADTTML